MASRPRFSARRNAAFGASDGDAVCAATPTGGAGALKRVISAARSSGALNLSNRQLTEVRWCSSSADHSHIVILLAACSTAAPIYTPGASSTHDL